MRKYRANKKKEEQMTFDDLKKMEIKVPQIQVKTILPEPKPDAPQKIELTQEEINRIIEKNLARTRAKLDEIFELSNKREEEREKEYRRKKALEYYNKNKDEINAKRRKKRKLAKERKKQREYQRKYYEEHKKEIQKYMREYQRKHRESKGA